MFKIGRKSLCALLLIAPLVALPSAPAHAGGSVSLEEKIGFVGQSGKLMGEIRTQLAAANQTIADIICSGVRLGRQWQHLGGARVLPYECDVAGRTLQINGTLYFYGVQGEYVDHNTNLEAAYTQAKYILEWNPTWTWQ